MNGGSASLRRDVAGRGDRSVERTATLHGRPVLVPGASSQIDVLNRSRDVEGLSRRRQVDSCGKKLPPQFGPQVS